MDQKLVRCMSSLKDEADAARMGADASDLNSLISDVSDLCKQAVSDEDISFAIALVFDREDGIFNVVQLLLPVKERSVVKARESCFTFVSEFIQQIGDRVLPHIEFVKEKCLLVFRRDDSKAVQAAALCPILSLLETDITRNTPSVVNLDWMFGQMLLNEYRKAKSSGTLRANILVLLGYLVEYFPRTFGEENVNILLKICLDTLDEQLRQSSKDPVFVLVSGVIKCLDSLLTWFDESLPAGGTVETSRKIYTYLVQIIYFREDIKRYEVVKAGLRLLSRHAKLFALRLVQDSKDILSWLQVYCTHTNALLRDAGFGAFNSFIAQVSRCFVHEESRLQNVQERYKHFMAAFFDILDEPYSDKKLQSLAIRGLGKLSPLIVRFSGKETLKKVFHRLTSLGGTPSSGGGDGYEDFLGHSVTLIAAFADMVIHFDSVEDFMVSFIAEVTGNIFYQFPNLFPKQRHAIYITMSALFEAMYLKGTIFTIFLSNVVWSTLQRTMETTEGAPGETGLPLWPQYVELWCQLLKFLDKSAEEQSAVPHDETDNEAELDKSKSEARTVIVKEIQVLVFDSIIRSIMKALTELNLKYRVRPSITSPSRQDDADVSPVEPETELELIEPLNLAHMRKYLNLVEFTEEFLSRSFAHLFMKWVYPFSCCVMELSHQYPLISGNYKLLTVTLKVADSKSFFRSFDACENYASDAKGMASEEEWKSLFKVSKDEETEGGPSVSKEHQALCLHLFRRYLREVLVASKRYKLELLASCLHLCLSAPPVLVDIRSLVAPIQNAFKIGLRYPPLASVAMDALERWHQLHPRELEQWLPIITRCLSDYISEVDKAEISDGSSEVGTTDSGTSRESLSRLQSTRLKKVRAQASQAGSFEVTQVRVQKFLGQIGSFNHNLVPELDLLQVAGTGGLAWDSVDRIQFTLPFRDDKFDIWLDPLLSRVVELAVSSSDRRTKVTASELLQALCLLMLGNSAKGPVHRKNENDRSVYLDKIYRRLLPAVLQLAVDVEQVTRQLFSEFVKQLIHWFTSNQQRENPETMALLDAILDGLVDPESGSLREFCAACFGEFMSWSVRHAPPEKNDFVNVASMLRRLYNRMDHPNPYKRLGAAMAAYRTYPILRGNSNIVDRYIFEIIFFCIKSLRLAELDDIQTGTAKQMNKTLDNIMKLVERNISALERTRKDRPMFLTLDEFLDWLLHQTAQLQETSRTRCMSLLSFICRLLAAGSLASWFRVKVEQGTDLESIVGVFSYEEEDRPFDVWSVEEARHQLAAFTRSLHWYEWALRQEMVTTSELRSTTDSSAVVKSFLHRIFSTPESGSQWQSLTPGERDSYGKLVRGAVFHLLGFTRQVLDSEFGTGSAGVFLPSRVNKDDIDMERLEGLIPLNEPGFIELLCLALLRPRELGFVVADTQGFADELAKLSVGVMQRLSVASSKFTEGLRTRLVNLLDDRKYDLSTFDFNLEGGGLGVEDTMSLLKGYQHLHLSGSLVSILGKSRAQIMGEKLMIIVYRIGRECPPLLESLASEMLQFSLALGASVQKLVELCLDEATTIHPSTENLRRPSQKVTPGGVFYLNFRRIIVQRLKFAFRDCLPLILDAAVRNPTARLLLNAVLDDQITSAQQGSDVSRGSFLKELFHHLHCLQPCVMNVELAEKQFFLEILQKVMLLDLSTENLLQTEESARNFIQDSFISCLDGAGVDTSAGKEADISLKTHAIALIPLLLKPAFTEEFHSRLCRSLTRVVSQHLLVREADLPKGSNQRAMYMRMLSRLLEAVSLSCSVILLEVIFPLLPDPPKFALRKLTESIDIFAQNIGEDRTACFNLCIRVLGDSTKAPRLKRALIERVFVPLVNAAPPDFVAKWYAPRIKGFTDVLAKNVESLDAEKEEESLTVKACHYMLVEVLFARVDAPSIKEHITPSAPNAPLIKLTMSEARAKNDPPTYLYPENTALWRDLHISAYKCLAAITLRTQEQEKVFGILFKEGQAGMIWQHLVDTEKVYRELPVQTYQFSTASQTVSGMRAQRKARRSLQGMSGTSTLSSQYVVNIGLSQEPAVISSFVGKAPTEESLQVSVDEDGNAGGDSDRTVSQEEKSSLEEAIDFIPADQDDFDQHPCMGVLLRLIEALHSRFGSGHREMPEWMKAMHSTLQNAGTHINIRLFLTKVVTKSWKVFAPHAQAWIVPLVQTVLTDPERSGGMTFHYILRDICITILQWNLPSPPDPGVASAFVTHLIRVSPHTTTPVLRANVDIIRVFLDSWKADLELDKLIILKEVVFGGRSASGTDRSVKMHRILGLQLFGAIAASGLQLYDASNDVFPEKDLYQALLENLTFKAKEIYEASAELIGIVMKQRHEAAQEFRRPIDEKLLESPLKQILLKFCKESNLEFFLNILNKITFRFPKYIESFSSLLVDLVPKLPGVFRVIALDIFLRFPSCLRGLLNMLLPTFTKVLTHRDEFAQLKCLQLLMELMKDVPDQKVQQKLLPVLCETFPTHENVDCRQAYYDLLIYFYSSNSSEPSELVARSLLAGLTDPAESVRSSLQKFWHSTLSQDLRDRLAEMINQMYDPSVEESWAQYSAVLLLKLCEESVDYTRKVFNAPLSDCEFHDYTIDTSYIGGSLPMTPLFSLSQTAHSQDSRSQAAALSQQEEEEEESRYPRQAGMIRATYSVTLSQTQDTSASYPQATQESSLYAMARKPIGGPSQTASQELGTSDGSSLGLRRRIPTGAARSQTIRSVVNARKRREARAAQQASERATKVRIMRRYRTGELPDIEIKHEDILAPLSSLAEKDGTFARLLLTVICRTVYSQSGGRQKDRTAVLKGQIAKGVEKALEKTRNGISFVGSVEAICLEDPTIWVRPKLVGRASLKSANFHSGILMLEGEILHETNSDTPAPGSSSKRQKGQAGKVTNEGLKLQEAWLELARLYKELGEEDIVLSVYQKKITEKPVSRRALEAQLGGDPSRALVLYDQALDTVEDETGDQASQVEQDIWYNQRLACLLELNRWQLLLEDTLTQVRSDDSEEPDLEKLWDPNLEEPYLGLFIRGAAKVSTYRSMADDFIQTSLKDPSKREVLMKDYGTQLATVAVANDQFDRARFYISHCYRSFRKHWTALHPLATGARHRQVEKLQKIVELEEFLDLMTNRRREHFPRKIIEWRHRWPSSKMDGVEAWDDIVQNRLVFFHKFQGLVNTLVSTGSRSMDGQDGIDSTPEALASKLERERAHIFHEAARGLTRVGAYNAAQSYMEEYMAAHQGTVTKGALDYRFFKGLVKLRCLQANRVKAIQATEATDMLLQVLSYIASTARKPWADSQDWKLGLKVLEASVSSQVAWMKINQLSKADGTISTVDDCVSLLGSAYSSYSDAAAKLSSGSSTEGSLKKSHQMAKVLLNFGLFCDELLKASKNMELSNDLKWRILQGDSTAGLPPASSYPTVIVKYMIEAVSLHTSVRAQHGLARVLSLVGQHPETHVHFASAIKQVPSWVFIPWIPQMLAVLDQEVGGILIPLLEDIAKLYPQALYFPFHVSEKDFGPLGRRRTRRLGTLLKSSALEGMVRGLEDLTFPEQRFKDGLSQMKNCIVAGAEKAVKVFAEVYEDCLDVNNMRNRGAGEYNFKFARDWTKRVIKALGENGSKLAKMDEKKFMSAVGDLLANLQKSMQNLQTGVMSLGHLSKWMAEFDQLTQVAVTPQDSLDDEGSSVSRSGWGGKEAPVEIPGQYSGFCEPRPDSHVKLVGFDQTLVCLSSKQRPKILTMRGSDEKEYKFVVKGGEDLRLDQRIEQLFEVMNSILQRDSQAARRGLTIRTYAVVPVSKSCGLLQFVENTCVLEDVVKDGLLCKVPSLSREGKNAPLNFLHNLRAQYHDWVMKRGGPSQNPPECYRNLYQKASSDEVTQKMRYLEGQLPWDTFRAGVARWATSAESFLALRSQFAKSLSVISICGYVAGVGDRHLANTLVDMSSGSLIPIDFGYSFGTGVILLPVPELVPFRLTNQLVNFLLPLDALGLLRTDMVHTLTALHARREVITAVMDVFVKEPLVDWKNEAMKTVGNFKDKKDDSVMEPSTFEQQYVELKVENAQRKLELWSPAAITISELKSSVHANKPYSQALEKIVKGSPDRNVRARISGHICQSVREQVDCLIDQATDPNLLGRIWQGWQPWL